MLYFCGAKVEAILAGVQYFGLILGREGAIVPGFYQGVVVLQKFYCF
jgi:hypothetical protein